MELGASDILERITYREAWLTLEALDAGDLSPYCGAALRGALGHLLRPALCDFLPRTTDPSACAGAGCGNDCQRPETCRYFSLFEKSRTAAGGNAPKPLILEAPFGEELETIAHGGPVGLPWRSGPPDKPGGIPKLRNEGAIRIAAGTSMRACIRVLGQASVALAGIVDAVARQGLSISGTRFLLKWARDGTGRTLYDRRFPLIPVQMPAPMRLAGEIETARAIRIVFLTPSVLKTDDAPFFRRPDFAERFFEHSMARAAQVHNCLTAHEPAPWMAAPQVKARITGHRLFQYVVPRRSYRQDKWMEFDGVAGYIDMEGDLTAGMPWARAAETLHFGQKATFGLGKVRVLVLE